MEVPAANDLARAFERATKARANALTMTADPTGLFVANQKQIVELAAKKRLPAIYTSSTYLTVHPSGRRTGAALIQALPL